MKLRFDSGEKLCGVGSLRDLPWYIPALKIHYALLALQPIRGRVLEIGCGAGGMVRSLASYRPDLVYTGCDINRKEIAAARKLASKIEFVYGNVYSLPFADDSFAGVVSFDVLEHLEDMGTCLDEVRRVLTPNGRFHFVMPCEGSRGNVEGILTHLGWRAKKVTCGHYPYSVRQIEQLLRSHNFRIQKRQFSGHLVQQLVDAFYFSFLHWRGGDVPYQVEGYISAEKGLVRNILWFVKGLVASIFYFESFLLWWFPGLHVHYTCVPIKNKQLL
jgi:SAM-dependent methyltransferase